MGLSRNILRAEAKKLYKEQIKGVPKKQRVPFAVFFKKYKNLTDKDNIKDIETTQNIDEDFNIEDIININNIDDDSVESSENIEKDFDIESIINVNKASDNME